MAMLKQLVDGLNWEEFRNREPEPFDKEIVSLHFYHNLAFIHKGENQEGTNKGQKHFLNLDQSIQKNFLPSSLESRQDLLVQTDALPVDVIIPVYRGLTETRTCLTSVLRYQQNIPHEVIVIDDASPEPELTAYLHELEVAGQITLLHNEQNRGFVKSVNLGMAVHSDRDVVLLNSDTEVAGDWLDRLRKCAYSDQHISTVTPFSNNATICSYPKSCANNSLPPGYTVQALDALFRRINAGQSVTLPTAVGFCMYIRRDCLRAVGLFDAARFGQGYGEENDFCMRATSAGWRHLLCGDVFVYHAGGISFLDSSNFLQQRAIATLRQIHPGYEATVQAHNATDPAKPLRLAVDAARLLDGNLPVVLFVVNQAAGGGTLKHVQELATLFGDSMQALLLVPLTDQKHVLRWLRNEEPFELYFNLPENYRLLCEVLRVLRVARIHFHHLLGVDASIWHMPQELGIPYDYTLHDYFPICPRINLTRWRGRYCGEPDETECNHCLRMSQPVVNDGTIQEWRALHAQLLNAADRVFAPSQDVKKRVLGYLPKAKLIFAPHPEVTEQFTGRQPSPMPLAATESLRVVVLGALSRFKGAEVLIECVLDATQRALPLEFHLLGHIDIPQHDLMAAPPSQLLIHGPYSNAELPVRLASINPHLAWFPAQSPETYSYTLSACLQAGLPIVASDLGAFPERLAGRSWSWLRPWQTCVAGWNDFFLAIREQHFAQGIAPPPLSGQTPTPEFDYIRDYPAPLLNISREQTDIPDYLVALYKTCAFATPTLERLPLPDAALSSVIQEAEVRLIAFYLPQFYPIPENDQWWGKGFTEWRNVTKATPLFQGHYQPRLPADLGFYDLRLAEVRIEQAELARRYGIYGFCYYYYWFNGRRLLERPLDDMLYSGQPDFPFCLCWANENWTRQWDGGDQDVLLAQTYSEANARQIIHDLMPFLRERRYITIAGKPLLLVYRTDIIPNISNMLDIWRKEAVSGGLSGLYLVRVESFSRRDPSELGFDAACEFPPHLPGLPNLNSSLFEDLATDFAGQLYNYEMAAALAMHREATDYKLFRGVMPSWDNTPRRNNRAHIFIKSSPTAYQNWLSHAIHYTLNHQNGDERLVFINAWNEWAEGCYLEPDLRYGHQFLEATLKVIESVKTSIDQPAPFSSLSVVFSTREIDQKFINHIRNTAGIQAIEVIPYANKNEFSLTELCNRGLKESKYDIVLFVHDDVIFNQKNWGSSLLRQFNNTDYGILGLAGTTDLIKDDKGIAQAWWAIKKRRVGRIRHEINGKLINTFYSNRYSYPIQVVCLDGVFIAVNKRRVKKPFDERFKGFHYYDIPFTFANHLAGVKVGVTFEIDLIHKSGGNFNSEWQENQLLFSRIYGDFLPCGVKPEKVDYDSNPIKYFNPGNSFISIIIPSKDKIELVVDCIESIINHTHIARYEILIADTGSTADNKSKLLNKIKEIGRKPNLAGIKVFEYDYYNFAKINNDMVKNHLSKKSSYLVFCNNDIKLLNDAVDRCLRLFKEKSKVGTVGVRLHYSDNSIQHNGMEILFGFNQLVAFTHRNIYNYYYYDREVVEVFGNTAAFLMIERPVFQKFYFNENYKECFEDVELNLEVLRLGRKNYHIGHAVAYHYESQTRNENPEKIDKVMEDYRNHLLPFFKKYCVPLFFTQLFEGASRASRAGQFQTAIEICKLLLEHAPDHADVHHLFGVVLGREGDQAGAVKHIRQAIALNGRAPIYHYNLAEALRRQGNSVLAEKSYEDALQLAPNLIEAYVKLAYVLEDQGHLDEALARYQQALQIKPDHATAHCGMGDTFRRQGLYPAAVECYQRALAIQPDFPEAHHNLGVLFYAANRLDEAAACFRTALYHKPSWPLAMTSLAMTLERQGLIEEARQYYRNLLAFEPDHALLQLRIERLCPAIMSSNADIDAYRERILVLLEELLDRGGLRLNLEQLHASNFEPPSLLTYQGRDDRPLKQTWAALFRNLLPEVECSPPLGGKPRIGFVVTRGHEGVFLKGMGGLLNQLSGERFDLTVVCSQQGGEAQLRSGLHNAAIGYLPLPERVEPSLELLRKARFHLLYYWEVGTDSVNYFLPFFRLAPVQCTGWGWPVTSGIPTIDYYLSCQSLETVEGDAYYSERLVRLQRLPTYFHRPEPPEMPVERERFGLAAGQPVYLCAQNLRKLHPDFDELLAGLLRRDPRGVVVLVEDSQPAITTALRQRLVNHLPDVVERVRFLPRLPHQDYLGLLAAADVVLDTLHFGGGVTTYEAFAVGTPIVTLPTTFSRGRYACAAYRQMGLMDGIAVNAEDYIELALRFAHEPDDRAAFSTRLREASTELFEDSQAVREFEMFLEAALAGTL